MYFIFTGANLDVLPLNENHSNNSKYRCSLFKVKQYFSLGNCIVSNGDTIKLLLNCYNRTPVVLSIFHIIKLGYVF